MPKLQACKSAASACGCTPHRCHRRAAAKILPARIGRRAPADAADGADDPHAHRAITRDLARPTWPSSGRRPPPLVARATGVRGNEGPPKAAPTALADQQHPRAALKRYHRSALSCAHHYADRARRSPREGHEETLTRHARVRCGRPSLARRSSKLYSMHRRSEAQKRSCARRKPWRGQKPLPPPPDETGAIVVQPTSPDAFTPRPTARTNKRRSA